jgi:hypothetical protein
MAALMVRCFNTFRLTNVASHSISRSAPGSPVRLKFTTKPAPMSSTRARVNKCHFQATRASGSGRSSAAHPQPGRARGFTSLPSARDIDPEIGYVGVAAIRRATDRHTAERILLDILTVLKKPQYLRTAPEVVGTLLRSCQVLTFCAVDKWNSQNLARSLLRFHFSLSRNCIRFSSSELRTSRTLFVGGSPLALKVRHHTSRFARPLLARTRFDATARRYR